MSPLVSIIMPAYNAEKYIKEAIYSLLENQINDLEVIVVNDGSTDQTLDVVKSIKDERVSAITQANKGVKRLAETINLGLSKATGEFVTMFPADDLCMPNRFEKQIPFFEDPDVVLVHGDTISITEEGNEIKSWKNIFKSKKTNLSQRLALQELITRNIVEQQSTLIRRNVLLKIGGYYQDDYMYAEDYPTHIHLALEGKFLYTPEVFAKYRFHPDQMTNIHEYQMIATDILFVEEFVQKNLKKIQMVGLSRAQIDKALQRRKAYDAYKLFRYYSKLGDRKRAMAEFRKQLAFPFVPILLIKSIILFCIGR